MKKKKNNTGLTDEQLVNLLKNVKKIREKYGRFKLNQDREHILSGPDFVVLKGGRKDGM